MRSPIVFLGTFLLTLLVSPFSKTHAACLKVADTEPRLVIQSSALANLGEKTNLDRKTVFDTLRTVAMSETNGCWSKVTGNFDKQYLSLGIMQWNFKQGSLQPVLRKYLAKSNTRGQGDRINDPAELMPNYRELLFSDGCLKKPVAPACVSEILAIQKDHRWSGFRSEVNALFESPFMRQVQLDVFVKSLGSIASDLTRLFPDRKEFDSRQIGWAIDTKTQQGPGGFPKLASVDRFRASIKEMNPAERREALLSMVDWYEGMTRGLYQTVNATDRAFNLRNWRQKIRSNDVSDTQLDLMHLAFLQTRRAQGELGRYQANAFKRRVKIILGCGSVGRRKVTDCGSAVVPPTRVPTGQTAQAQPAS